MFHIVLNNGQHIAVGGEEHFQLVLPGDWNQTLTVDHLAQRISSVGLPCELIFETHTLCGILYIPLGSVGAEMILQGSPSRGWLTLSTAGHTEVVLQTERGTMQGVIYGSGTTAMSLGLAARSGMDTWGNAAHDWVELNSQPATAMLVAPLYVGDQINETISALGDITMSEFMWEELA